MDLFSREQQQALQAIAQRETTLQAHAKAVSNLPSIDNARDVLANQLFVDYSNAFEDLVAARLSISPAPQLLPAPLREQMALTLDVWQGFLTQRPIGLTTLPYDAGQLELASKQLETQRVFLSGLLAGTNSNQLYQAWDLKLYDFSKKSAEEVQQVSAFLKTTRDEIEKWSTEVKAKCNMDAKDTDTLDEAQQMYATVLFRNEQDAVVRNAARSNLGFAVQQTLTRGNNTSQDATCANLRQMDSYNRPVLKSNFAKNVVARIVALDQSARRMVLLQMQQGQVETYQRRNLTAVGISTQLFDNEHATTLLRRVESQLATSRTRLADMLAYEVKQQDPDTASHVMWHERILGLHYSYAARLSQAPVPTPTYDAQKAYFYLQNTLLQTVLDFEIGIESLQKLAPTCANNQLVALRKLKTDLDMKTLGVFASYVPAECDPAKTLLRKTELQSELQALGSRARQQREIYESLCRSMPLGHQRDTCLVQQLQLLQSELESQDLQNSVAAAPPVSVVQTLQKDILLESEPAGILAVAQVFEVAALLPRMARTHVSQAESVALASHNTVFETLSLENLNVAFDMERAFIKNAVTLEAVSKVDIELQHLHQRVTALQTSVNAVQPANTIDWANKNNLLLTLGAEAALLQNAIALPSTNPQLVAAQKVVAALPPSMRSSLVAVVNATQPLPLPLVSTTSSAPPSTLPQPAPSSGAKTAEETDASKLRAEAEARASLERAAAEKAAALRKKAADQEAEQKRIADERDAAAMRAQQEREAAERQMQETERVAAQQRAAAEETARKEEAAKQAAEKQRLAELKLQEEKRIAREREEAARRQAEQEEARQLIQAESERKAREAEEQRQIEQKKQQAAAEAQFALQQAEALRVAREAELQRQQAEAAARTAEQARRDAEAAAKAEQEKLRLKAQQQQKQEAERLRLEAEQKSRAETERQLQAAKDLEAQKSLEVAKAQQQKAEQDRLAALQLQREKDAAAQKALEDQQRAAQEAKKAQDEVVAQRLAAEVEAKRVADEAARRALKLSKQAKIMVNLPSLLRDLRCQRSFRLDPEASTVMNNLTVTQRQRCMKLDCAGLPTDKTECTDLYPLFQIQQSALEKHVLPNETKEAAHALVQKLTSTLADSADAEKTLRNFLADGASRVYSPEELTKVATATATVNSAQSQYTQTESALQQFLHSKLGQLSAEDERLLRTPESKEGCGAATFVMTSEHLMAQQAAYIRSCISDCSITTASGQPSTSACFQKLKDSYATELIRYQNRVLSSEEQKNLDASWLAITNKIASAERAFRDAWARLSATTSPDRARTALAELNAARLDYNNQMQSLSNATASFDARMLAKTVFLVPANIYPEARRACEDLFATDDQRTKCQTIEDSCVAQGTIFCEPLAKLLPEEKRLLATRYGASAEVTQLQSVKMAQDTNIDQLRANLLSNIADLEESPEATTSALDRAINERNDINVQLTDLLKEVAARRESTIKLRQAMQTFDGQQQSILNLFDQVRNAQSLPAPKLLDDTLCKATMPTELKGVCEAKVAQCNPLNADEGGCWDMVVASALYSTVPQPEALAQMNALRAKINQDQQDILQTEKTIQSSAGTTDSRTTSLNELRNKVQSFLKTRTQQLETYQRLQEDRLPSQIEAKRALRILNDKFGGSFGAQAAARTNNGDAVKIGPKTIFRNFSRSGTTSVDESFPDASATLVRLVQQRTDELQTLSARSAEIQKKVDIVRQALESRASSSVVVVDVLPQVTSILLELSSLYDAFVKTQTQIPEAIAALDAAQQAFVDERARLQQQKDAAIEAAKQEVQAQQDKKRQQELLRQRVENERKVVAENAARQKQEEEERQAALALARDKAIADAAKEQQRVAQEASANATRVAQETARNLNLAQASQAAAADAAIAQRRANEAAALANSVREVAENRQKLNDATTLLHVAQQQNVQATDTLEQTDTRAKRTKSSVSPQEIESRRTAIVQETLRESEESARLHSLAAEQQQREQVVMHTAQERKLPIIQPRVVEKELGDKDWCEANVGRKTAAGKAVPNFGKTSNLKINEHFVALCMLDPATVCLDVKKLQKPLLLIPPRDVLQNQGMQFVIKAIELEIKAVTMFQTLRATKLLTNNFQADVLAERETGSAGSFLSQAQVDATALLRTKVPELQQELVDLMGPRSGQMFTTVPFAGTFEMDADVKQNILDWANYLDSLCTATRLYSIVQAIYVFSEPGKVNNMWPGRDSSSDTTHMQQKLERGAVCISEDQRRKLSLLVTTPGCGAHAWSNAVPDVLRTCGDLQNIVITPVEANIALNNATEYVFRFRVLPLAQNLLDQQASERTRSELRQSVLALKDLRIVCQLFGDTTLSEAGKEVEAFSLFSQIAETYHTLKSRAFVFEPQQTSESEACKRVEAICTKIASQCKIGQALRGTRRREEETSKITSASCKSSLLEALRAANIDDAQLTCNLFIANNTELPEEAFTTPLPQEEEET